MRQIWATGAAWLAGGGGTAALVYAFASLDGRGRLLLIILALVAAAVGFVGGFALLESQTAWAR